MNTVDRYAVAYDARNGTLNEELSGTLQEKESGGWSLNYINPVIESSNPAGVLCMASTQANAERLMDCGTTLNLDKDRTIIAHRNEATVNYTFGKTSRPHFKGDAPTYLQLDTANTVNTFDTGESRANELAVQGVPPHYIVRRLMPIECGRLQGFPDGWGEIKRLSADMPEEVAAFWRGVYTTERAIKGKRAQKSILERVDKLVEWYNRLHTKHIAALGADDRKPVKFHVAAERVGVAGVGQFCPVALHIAALRGKLFLCLTVRQTEKRVSGHSVRPPVCVVFCVGGFVYP